ncbi:surf-like protein [Dimargaris xerosporica]|nr:surf-like protein [Dimargaris xerosporica]
MLLVWARNLGARLRSTAPLCFQLRTTSRISTSATAPHNSPFKTTCYRHAFHTERVFQRANQERRRGLGRVVLGFVPFICIGLGTWQVYRLRWKEDLIARIDARLNDPVAALPKTTDPLMVDDWEFRKVLLVGQFCHDQEMLIGPRAHEGENGYMVITPLVREDG